MPYEALQTIVKIISRNKIETSLETLIITGNTVQKNCNEKGYKIIVNDILTLNRCSDNWNMALCWCSFIVQCPMRRVTYYLLVIHGDGAGEYIHGRVFHYSKITNVCPRKKVANFSTRLLPRRKIHQLVYVPRNTNTNCRTNNFFPFSITAKDYGVCKYWKSKTAAVNSSWNCANCYVISVWW